MIKIIRKGVFILIFKVVTIAVLTTVLFCTIGVFAPAVCAADSITMSIRATVATPKSYGWALSTSSLVTLTTKTPGATIYYTLDGSIPTTNSTKYDGPFAITFPNNHSSVTIKAIAVKVGMNDSPVMAVTYNATCSPGFQPASIPITTSTVTIIDRLHKNLAITQDTLKLNTPITITVPSAVTDAKISIVALMNKPLSSLVTTSPLPAINIVTSTKISGTPIQVAIPAGVTISAPSDWSGTINVPRLEPEVAALYLSSLTNTTVDTVIEVGCGNTPLTFSKAVRLTLPDQAGKSVGYYRNETFTNITRICTQDNQNWADTNIPDGESGMIDVGNDLVIWTKHFTEFFTYTQTISSDRTIT